MANTSADFSAILERAPSEVERPKALPTGTYLVVVKGQPQFDKSTKKQTPFAKFNLGFLQALEDVDEEELEQALTSAEGTKTALTEKSINHTLYLTENSAWRLDEFLEHCGIELDGKKSRSQMIEETPGCQLLISIKHRASEDGQSVFAEIGKTAKAE